MLLDVVYTASYVWIGVSKLVKINACLPTLANCTKDFEIRLIARPKTLSSAKLLNRRIMSRLQLLHNITTHLLQVETDFPKAILSMKNIFRQTN